jgi:hypothetical protein
LTNPVSSTARPETKARIQRWRELAIAIARKHPTWGNVRIAQQIQKSASGKRKGGVLPYSISAILKDIRSR